MKKKIIITVFLIFWSAVFAAIYCYIKGDRAEIHYYRSTEIAIDEEF